MLRGAGRPVRVLGTALAWLAGAVLPVFLLLGVGYGAFLTVVWAAMTAQSLLAVPTPLPGGDLPGRPGRGPLPGDP